MADYAQLVCDAAWKARQFAYAPYSEYRVGAALLLEGGNIVIGANVENSIYGLTECAERVAIFKWRTSILVDLPIVALAYSTDVKQFAPPCGACLQVIKEHVDPNILVFHYNGKSYKSWYFKDLLPHSTVISSLDKTK